MRNWPNLPGNRDLFLHKHVIESDNKLTSFLRLNTHVAWLFGFSSKFSTLKTPLTITFCVPTALVRSVARFPGDLFPESAARTRSESLTDLFPVNLTRWSWIHGCVRQRLKIGRWNKGPQSGTVHFCRSGCGISHKK